MRVYYVSPRCPVCSYLLRAIVFFNLGRPLEKQIQIQPIDPEYEIPEWVKKMARKNFPPFEPTIPFLIFDDFMIFPATEDSVPHWKELYYMLVSLDKGGD